MKKQCPQVFQIWWKTLVYTCKKFNQFQEGETQREPHLDTSKSNCWTIENLENSLRKTTYHVQGLLLRLTGFLIRKHASQKTIKWYIQHAEGRKLSIKNLLSGRNYWNISHKTDKNQSNTLVLPKILRYSGWNERLNRNSNAYE
jgi:hypothetical protein